jgi:ubiquitin-like 1-activating enzyme E1 B
LSEEVKIPTKPKKTPAPETNGQSSRAPKHGIDSEAAKPADATPAKRPHPESIDDSLSAKKARIAAAPKADDEVILVESGAGGAIVIDDD